MASGILYILPSDLFQYDNKFVFKAKKILIFRHKSDDYLYLFIINLENFRLNRFSGTQYPFEFVWAGRGF